MPKLGYIVGGAVVVFVAIAAGAYFSLRPRYSSADDLNKILSSNGYVELRPPSNLFLPGTWVEVLASDPLRLSIICDPQDALGLADPNKLPSSASESVGFQSELSPKFDLDAATLRSLKAKADLTAIRSVTFSLSNVKLQEIADAEVFGGFKSRVPECGKAIAFRIRDPKHPVSMVKSALIADVEYVVDFSGDVAASAKTKAIGDLALDLGAKVENSDTTKTRLVGRGLVWGIRDDATLATFGYDLPATGGTTQQRSILLGHGPIVGTDGNAMARRTFSGKKKLVSYNVSPLKQSTAMGCWATVYAMLKSWKERKDWSPARAVAALGPIYVDRYVSDSGLPGGGERKFVADASMVAEPPADYTLGGYLDMLRKDGPLWITLGDGLNSHALLLVGIYGNSEAETKQAYDDAIFEFIDPMTGAYSYQPADDFMARFEQEAGVIVNNKAFDLDLRWQIIHWPSA